MIVTNMLTKTRVLAAVHRYFYAGSLGSEPYGLRMRQSGAGKVCLEGRPGIP